MGTPPKGVDDVFAATMVLLAGTSPSVITTKAGKVKDRSWDAAKKQLLGEVRLSTAHQHSSLVPLNVSLDLFYLLNEEGLYGSHPKRVVTTFSDQTINANPSL